jgi:hypothetical protein
LARGGVPEAALLSEASKVARRLKEIVVDGLERNADYIIDCSVRFGVFGAGFLFLRECGVDSYLSGILSGLMNLGVKRRGEKKKGGGNTKRK